jgi:hypothetical protein
MIMRRFNLYRIAATMPRQAPHSLYTYNTDCVDEINEHFQTTDLFHITLRLAHNLKYYMIVFLQMLTKIAQSV